MPRKQWTDVDPRKYRNVFLRMTNLMSDIQDGDQVTFYVVVNEKHKNDERVWRQTEAINVRKKDGGAGTARNMNEGPERPWAPRLYIRTDPQKPKTLRPCAPIVRSGSVESETMLRNREARFGDHDAKEGSEASEARDSNQ